MSETNFIQQLLQAKANGQRRFPDKEAAERFIKEIFDFLFIDNSDAVAQHSATETFADLKEALAVLLKSSVPGDAEAAEHVALFFDALPALYQTLLNDAEAILRFDPAAHNLAEVVVAYPGFYATVVYRLSHRLWEQGVRVLPRLFSEFAHSKTGIDIHPAATIGSHFAIDHGTGLVVGESAVIGNNVKLYQGVTLGALNVAKSLASTKRHPTVEDDVVIYSGATILGGDTVIGSGSIIGGNVWLTYSVPPNSVVYHQSEIKIKDRNPFPEPINFVI